MAETDPNQTPEHKESSSYTPAATEKRIAAWIGIVYALIFCFIITFSMYCPDKSLAGTFPLLLVPVAVGIIIISIYKQRCGTARGGLPSTVFIILVCLIVIAAALWLGVPVLAIAFGG